MYVCMHVCMYMYVYIRISKSIDKDMYVSIYVYRYIYIYPYVSVDMHGRALFVKPCNMGRQAGWEVAGARWRSGPPLSECTGVVVAP